VTETPEYRFQYGLTAAYGDNTTWTAYTGTYCHEDITGLTAGTGYHFRTQIRTSYGLGSGSDTEFTTYSGAGNPSDMMAVANSGTDIGVSWVMGAGSTESILRYQTGSFPANYSDGILAYQGPLSSYTCDNLTAGTTYYFRVWGHADPAYYSTSYDNATCTTLAGVTPGTEALPVWDNTTPSTTTITGAPFYDVIDWASSYMNFTTNALVLFIFMVVAIMLTITVAVFSRGSMLITAAGSTVIMAIGTTQHIVPFWMVVIAFILSLVLAYNRSHQAA
jgi:hypothetical protein